MYQTYLGIILAGVAIWIAASQRKRISLFESHISGLYGRDLSARDVHAERIILSKPTGKQGSGGVFKRIEIGWGSGDLGRDLPALHFVHERNEGHPSSETDLAFNTGKDGLRFELWSRPSDDLPHCILTVALFHQGITVLDGHDKVIATVPRAEE